MGRWQTNRQTWRFLESGVFVRRRGCHVCKVRNPTLTKACKIISNHVIPCPRAGGGIFKYGEDIHIVSQTLVMLACSHRAGLFERRTANKVTTQLLSEPPDGQTGRQVVVTGFERDRTSLEHLFQGFGQIVRASSPSRSRYMYI
jgi:hypothetical protein